MALDIASLLASLHCFLSVSGFITGGSQVYPVVTCGFVVTGLSSALAYALLYFGASGLPCTA